MNKNPFEVFKRDDDYVSWDKYHEQLDLIELAEADRGRARGAISYLRNLLGEDFLQIAWQQGNPILPWFFLNAAPRARLSLISLTSKYLPESKGFSANACRHLVATEYIKNEPNGWEVAAEAPHHTADTVRKHYSWVVVGDRIKPWNDYHERIKGMHDRGETWAQREHVAYEQQYSDGAKGRRTPEDMTSDASCLSYSRQPYGPPFSSGGFYN